MRWKRFELIAASVTGVDLSSCHYFTSPLIEVRTRLPGASQHKGFFGCVF